MKKVLILAYIFPPLGGSGVQRTLKFTRYLPQFGWQPVVVCGDDGTIFQDGYDPALLAEIPPDVLVYRARFRSPLAFRRRVQRGLRIKGRAQPDENATLFNQEQAGDDQQQSSRLRLFLRLLSAPLAPFEFPPIDAALYWALSVTPFCARLIRREKIAVVFTTSFPYSDHVAGYLLKRLTGKPWVADFRDPWTQNAASGNRGWRRSCDQRMERAILKYADRVIGVTPTYTHGLRELAARQPAAKFITIENGYDLEDFRPVDRPGGGSGKNGKTTIAHVGKAYNGTLLPLLEAVQRISAEDQARLKLRFISGLPQPERDWLSRHPLAAEVEMTGRLSHAQAIAAMRQADVVFLPIGADRAWSGHYPGKLFEYLACDTPILLIGPDGDAARLVLQSGAGCAVLPEDTDRAARILHLLAADPRQFKTQFYQPDAGIIARYERRNLSQRLACVFDELSP